METVHFEVSISGFLRDDYSISMHGVVKLSSTVKDALAHVQSELANLSFLSYAHKLLIEHLVDTEQWVRLEIYQNGAMVRIPWETTVSAHVNRTFYINIDDVSLVQQHIELDPASP